MIVQLALASLSDAFLLAKVKVLDMREISLFSSFPPPLLSSSLLLGLRSQEPEPLMQPLRQEEEKTQKEKEALHDQAILKEEVRLQVSKSKSSMHRCSQTETISR